jgi:hypothetical protein
MTFSGAMELSRILTAQFATDLVLSLAAKAGDRRSGGQRCARVRRKTTTPAGAE